MDPLPTSDPETRALDGARAGDPSALRRLYEQLAPRVLGYARGQGVEDPDAVANEALYRVLRDVRAFDGDARAFRSWVFAITHNLIVDEHRRRSRRPATVPLERGADGTAVQPDPAGAVAESLEVDQMLRWIDDLSPDQRDVLLLRLVAELPIAEVAAIVAKRPGAVKALQRRGLASLRRRLDAEGVSRGPPSTFTRVP